MSTLTRAMIDGLLPRGAAWRIQPGGFEDKLLNAKADNLGTVYDFLATLDNVRDPITTPVFDDLERELGITKNPYLTLAQRVAIAANRKFTKGLSTLPALQAALDAAGFGQGGYGLMVYDNNGGANPSTFTTGTSNIIMGGPGQYMGTTAAFMGFNGGNGTMIVNGPLFTQAPGYLGFGTFQMGGTGGGAGFAYFGYYNVINYTPIVYQIPTDPGYWPLFFFLGQNPVYTTPTTAFIVDNLGNYLVTNTGANMTTNGGTGNPVPYISSLVYVNIPSARQAELIELITRWKPIHAWGILMANWT